MKECIVICAVLVMSLRFGSALKLPFHNKSVKDIIRIPFLVRDIIMPIEPEFRWLLSKKSTLKMVENSLLKFRFKKGHVPKKKKEISPSVDPMISGIVEKFKATLKVGLPAYGIPAFDPLTVDDVELQIRDIILTSQIEIKNVEINGISDFEIEVLKVDYSNYTFYFAFVLPLLQIDLDYVITAHVVKYFPFTIGGHVNWISRFIDISGVGALRVEDGLGLNGFDMSLDIKENKLKIGRIFGLRLIDRGLSWILNKFANVWFNMFKKKISIKISDTIFDMVNSALKGVSLTTILFSL